MLTSRYIQRVAPWFSVCIALVSGALAQAIAPSTSSKSSDSTQGSDAVQLSPFVVQTNQDTGYAAQNTISGSRLNTSLADTPAAISVFTPQFIQDIGATDVIDLVQYSVNTDSDLLTGSPQNVAAAGDDPVISIRGISAGRSGLYTNFFPSSLVQDTYNLERAELTRGPNSVLYGIGLPAGGFNVTTKKADVRRPIYGASFRFGSYHQARGTLDANVPVIVDKLAVRLDAVAEDQNDWHPFAYKQGKRWQLAAGWQVAKHTRLDVEYENGHRWFATAPQNGVYDAITPWIAAGRKIDTQVGRNFPDNAAMELITANRMIYDQTSGRLDNGVNQSVGVSAGETAGTPVGTGQIREIDDFTLLPRNTFLGGPGWGHSNSFNRFTTTFSHEVFRNLNVELAYNREASDSFNNDTLRNSATANIINVDPNALLPNGQPNPHVGQYYIDTVGTLGFGRSRADDYRASASYEYDFSEKHGLLRWLGKHRFVALGQFRHLENFTGQWREFVTTNPVSTASPDNANNQLTRRTYIDLNGSVGKIGIADARLAPVVGVINQTTGRPVTSEYLLSSQPTDASTKTNTLLLVWQGNFWHERIVPTVGYRKDRVENWGAPLVVGRAPGYGPFTQGGVLVERTAAPDLGYGITRTYGGVIHATRWLSFFYNHSSSFSLPPNNTKLFPPTFAGPGNVTGTPALGQTDDYGAKFPLWKGKVFGTITYYQTGARNQSQSGGLTLYKQQIPAIWRTLDNAGLLAPNGLTLDAVTAAPSTAQAHTFDNDSQGWEFEVTANPMPNWRILINYSTNRTVGSNNAREIVQYYAANQGFWTQGTRVRLVVDGTPGQLAANAIDPKDGLTTIAESLQMQLDSLTQQFVAPDGARTIGTPISTANMRTNYSFREGFARGFGLGLGGRWRGQRVLAYTTSDPATRRPIGGPARLDVDADVSYQTKVSLLGRKTNLTFRLNFTNLINNKDLIYLDAYPDGIRRTFAIPAPRAWFLTVSSGF